MPIPGTHPPATKPPLVTAFVAKAPTATSDDLLVRIPMFGNALSTAFAWEPRAPLPLVGDECLVAYDERGNPWVVGWVGDVVRPPLVSALPSEPRDGQEVYFQTATLAAAGVVWHLRYNAASASAYKWEFIGGSDYWQQTDPGSEVTHAVAFQAVAVTGAPTFTTPLAGDWKVDVAAFVTVITNPLEYRLMGGSLPSSFTSQDVAGTIAGSIAGSVGDAGQVNPGRLPAQAAGTVFTVLSMGGVGKIRYYGTTLIVRPIRVG